MVFNVAIYVAPSIVAKPYKEQVLIEARLLFCWFH